MRSIARLLKERRLAAGSADVPSALRASGAPLAKKG
jgi:hypothetical protein